MIERIIEVPFMVRIFVVYILTYLYGTIIGNVSDGYLMGSILITILVATIPNLINLIPKRDSKKLDLVETTTVNASLLKRKLDAGGSFELIINNETIDLVGE